MTGPLGAAVRGDGPPGTRTRRTALVAHSGADLYGSDRMLLESVSALRQAGWDVVVTVPGDGPLLDRLRAAGATTVVCPTPVLRASALSPRGMVGLLRETVAGLRAGSRLVSRVRPRLVYVNTVAVPLWLLVARLRGVPALCHVHEAEASRPAWVRGVLALPVLLADVVVGNSRFTIDVLARSFGRLRRRSRLVLNAVPGPPEPLMARAVLDGGVRVVYVGRLSPRKGVDVAVDAIARLRQAGVPASLDVVGAPFPGYEWYVDELRDRVRRADLTDHVRLHGFREVVWDAVASGDVVVVPSRSDESFGNAAVEAVLCARPVVVSGTSGLLEATAGYRGAQTVPPDDPGALAEAITRVAHDWDRWRAAAWADAEQARARHAPAVFRDRLVAVVEEMVER